MVTMTCALSVLGCSPGQAPVVVRGCRDQRGHISGQGLGLGHRRDVGHERATCSALASGIAPERNACANDSPAGACPEHPCATRSTDVTCCTSGLGADEPAAATSQSIVEHPFAFADPRCTTSPATATSTRSRAHRSRPMRLIAAASPSSP